jgi:hypothetical protein
MIIDNVDNRFVEKLSLHLSIDTQKVKFHWIGTVAWYIIQQAPSYKALSSFVQNPRNSEWECPSPCERRYLRQPSESELGLLTSGNSAPGLSCLIWATTFIHRRAISKFLDIPETQYNFLMLLTTLDELLGTRNTIKSPFTSSQQLGANIYANTSLWIYIGIIDSNEIRLANKKGVLNQAKVDHLLQFCMYYTRRISKAEGSQLFSVSVFCFMFCREISAMDLSDWNCPGDNVLISMAS